MKSEVAHLKRNWGLVTLISSGFLSVLLAATSTLAKDEPGPGNQSDGSGLENTATVTGTFGRFDTPVTPNSAFENVDMIGSATDGVPKSSDCSAYKKLLKWDEVDAKIKIIQSCLPVN